MKIRNGEIAIHLSEVDDFVWIFTRKGNRFDIKVDGANLIVRRTNMDQSEGDVVTLEPFEEKEAVDRCEVDG